MSRPPGSSHTGIGKHLRTLRQQAGLSQTEVARRSGLSREAVCAFETDRHDPMISTVRRICDAIGARIHIGLEEGT